MITIPFQSGGGGGGANMPKKKGEYSVLSEVNTEDEWLQLCKKEARENPKMKDMFLLLLQQNVSCML